MPDYAELRAQARKLFADMSNQQMQSAQDCVTFWMRAVEIGTAFTAGTLMSTRPRLTRADFNDADVTWGFIKKSLAPLEKVGCVEPRLEGRKTVGYVLLEEKFNVKVAEQIVERRKKSRRGPAKVETVTVFEKSEERIVYRKPPRKEGVESRAIVIDIANVTKRHGPNGRPLLPINRINWNAFRNALQLNNGVMMPLERLVLCVSAGYAADNRLALSFAQRAGFEVVTRYGEKGADPVVGHQLRDVVITAVVKNYLDRIPTIVLVSGDADFCADLDDMKELARLEGLTLPIHVISWEESLARVLDLKASKTTALDEMVGRIRLP